jgi:hypothetical protein
VPIEGISVSGGTRPVSVEDGLSGTRVSGISDCGVVDGGVASFFGAPVSMPMIRGSFSAIFMLPA